jgi:hypothetical protein
MENYEKIHDRLTKRLIEIKNDGWAGEKLLLENRLKNFRFSDEVPIACQKAIIEYGNLLQDIEAAFLKYEIDALITLIAEELAQTPTVE